MRRLIMGLVFATVSLSLPALAQGPSGTAEEAKAMLTKAISAVKADRAKALEMFSKGEGGFKDRDLYVFCANVSDGKLVAHVNPQLINVDVRTLKDSAGNNFGQINFDLGIKAKEGEITQSPPYLFPRPGPDKTPASKVAFMSKIGDVYCGVGYYK
jgi:Single Cache domain 2